MRDCLICFLICEIAPRCVVDLVLDTPYLTGVSLGFPSSIGFLFEKGSHTVAQASLNLTSDPPGMFTSPDGTRTSAVPTRALPTEGPTPG